MEFARPADGVIPAQAGMYLRAAHGNLLHTELIHGYQVKWPINLPLIGGALAYRQ